MRVLASTTAGAGHFAPLAAFAVAVRDAGHEVVVAAPASFASTIEGAGLVHRPFADASGEELGAVFSKFAGLSNHDGNAIVIGEVFGRINTTAALPGMRAIVEEFRPDVVLRESSEFSSLLVAGEAGIPHAQVACGLAAYEEEFRPVVERALVALRKDLDLVALKSVPRLTLLPESFEDPAFTGSDVTRRFRRTANAGSESRPLPDWWGGGSSDPLIYVTFGSVAAGIGLFPDFYRGVIAGLAGLPLRALVTVGAAGDPQVLEPLPPNVHVERWWPQEQLMPHVAALVGHGGFGTTFSGLAAGVPMVVVPLFADQPATARRVAEAGAGIALDGGPAAAGSVGEAVLKVLSDSSYRDGVERIAADISRLPPVSEAVTFLQSLA